MAVKRKRRGYAEGGEVEDTSKDSGYSSWSGDDDEDPNKPKIKGGGSFAGGFASGFTGVLGSAMGGMMGGAGGAGGMMGGMMGGKAKGGPVKRVIRRKR